MQELTDLSITFVSELLNRSYEVWQGLMRLIQLMLLCNMLCVVGPFRRILSISFEVLLDKGNSGHVSLA